MFHSLHSKKKGGVLEKSLLTIFNICLTGMTPSLDGKKNAPVQSCANCGISSRWHSWHCSGWMHSECIMGCMHQQLQRWCWCKTIPSLQPQRGTVRLQNGADGWGKVWSSVAAAVTWLSFLWNHTVFSLHSEASTNMLHLWWIFFSFL